MLEMPARPYLGPCVTAQAATMTQWTLLSNQISAAQSQSKVSVDDVHGSCIIRTRCTLFAFCRTLPRDGKGDGGQHFTQALDHSTSLSWQ